RHVIVHGFGDGHHLDALRVEVHAVAQRIIPSGGDHVVDVQPFQGYQDFWCDVVHLLLVGVLQVFGHLAFGHVAAEGAGGMQKGAARRASIVYYFAGQDLVIVAVVMLFIPDDIDHAAPSAADADYIVTLSQGPDRDGPDGRVQPGHIAAAGQDANDAF